MTSARSLVPRVGRLLRRLRPRDVAHREVTIAGPDQTSVWRLAGTLLNATRDGANVLHSDDQVAAYLRRQTVDGAVRADGLSFEALYLGGERGRKSKRWRFHVPGPLTPDAQEAGSTWKTVSDTMILDWPLAYAGQSVKEALDAIYHLNGRLSEARDRGRLRRAAIVVSALPDQLAPRDVAQVQLVLKHRENFYDGLARLLDEGDAKCGDPLADRQWREFLRQRVAGSTSLDRLYENTSLSLDCAIPLFFFPAVPQRSGDAAALLTWIAAERAPSVRRRRRLLGVLDVALAAALALVLAVFAALAGVDGAVDDALLVRAETALAQPGGNAESAAGLAPAIRERADHYRRLAAWLPGPLNGVADSARLLTTATALDTLAGALSTKGASDRDLQRYYSWADSLRCLASSERRQIRENIEDFRNVGLPARLSMLRESLAQRDLWSAASASIGIPPDSLAVVDTYLGDLIWTAAFSTIRFEAQTDERPDRIVADPAGVAACVEAASAREYSALARALQPLREPIPCLAFYQDLEAMREFVAASGTVEPATVTACLAFVPDIPAGEIIAAMRGASLQSIATGSAAYLARLDDLAGIRNVEIDNRRFVTQEHAAAAGRLRTALTDALAERPMTIEVRGSESAWHLHAASSANGPFTETCSDPGRGQVRVINLVMRPFRPLYVRYCGTSSEAFAADGQWCYDGKATQVVRLDAQQRLFTIEGQVFEICVTAGWPQWPPQD